MDTIPKNKLCSVCRLVRQFVDCLAIVRIGAEKNELHNLSQSSLNRNQEDQICLKLRT